MGALLTLVSLFVIARPAQTWEFFRQGYTSGQKLVIMFQCKDDTSCVVSGGARLAKPSATPTAAVTWTPIFPVATVTPRPNPFGTVVPSP